MKKLYVYFNSVWTLFLFCMSKNYLEISLKYVYIFLEKVKIE